MSTRWSGSVACNPIETHTGHAAIQARCVDRLRISTAQIRQLYGELADRPKRYNVLMPRDAAELLRDALSLPAEARAALADSLLESLDVEVDGNAEEVWREEIYRRLQQIDSGAVRLIPWDDAERRLWARLER